MENFNKIISFILGVIVLIVLIALLTGKLNIKDRLASLTGGKKTSPTPSMSISPTPVVSSEVKGTNTSSTPIITRITPIAGGNTSANTGTNKATNSKAIDKSGSIPASGAPIAVIPLALVGLGAGLGLNRAGRKS